MSRHAGPRITVVGCHTAVSGVGEAARQTLRSLAANGIDVEGLDVGTPAAGRDESCSSFLRETSAAPIQIFHVNAVDLPFVLDRYGDRLRPDAARVCVPFWELSDFPAPWAAHLDLVDEVWAPSRFIQASIARRLGRPVVHVPVATEIGQPVAPLPRARFGLPANRFLFFFAFDFLSFMERKNPGAAVTAFREAFPQHGRAALVLKCVNGAREPGKLAALRAEIDGHPDIVLLDRALSRDDMLGLIASADALLSLHRSEGLGLLVSEAMWLGKPVIATDYSGTQDVLSAATGFPVGCRLVPVNEGEYLFPQGQVWADPDIGQAAWLMRRLRDEPGCAGPLVANARRLLAERHGYRPVGRVLARRAEQATRRHGTRRGEPTRHRSTHGAER